MSAFLFIAIYAVQLAFCFRYLLNSCLNYETREYFFFGLYLSWRLNILHITHHRSSVFYFFEKKENAWLQRNSKLEVKVCYSLVEQFPFQSVCIAAVKIDGWICLNWRNKGTIVVIYVESLEKAAFHISANGNMNKTHLKYFKI